MISPPKKSFSIVVSCAVLIFVVVAWAGGYKPIRQFSKRLVTKCHHGLYHQPLGTFAVFFTCDGPMGNNIGVINVLPGATPGRIDLGQQKIWDWGPTSRYWHDAEWAADVTGFAWSPSGKYLYVATSSVYGDGHLFELDLVLRTAKKIFPRPLLIVI